MTLVHQCAREVRFPTNWYLDADGRIASCAARSLNVNANENAPHQRARAEYWLAMVRGELEGGWDGGSRRGDRYRRQRSVEVRARWAGGGRGGVVQRRWGGDDVSLASRAAARHRRRWP